MHATFIAGVPVDRLGGLLSSSTLPRINPPPLTNNIIILGPPFIASFAQLFALYYIHNRNSSVAVALRSVEYCEFWCTVDGQTMLHSHSYYYLWATPAISFIF